MFRPPIAMAALVLMLTACVLSGCGGNRRQGVEVEGVVTLDGRPLESGTIAFRPASGTTSPSAGAKIEAGRFALPADDGPFAGEFLVEITARRDSGRRVVDPNSGALLSIPEQYLPARYNEQTELTATIGTDAANQLTFHLESNP